VPARRATAPGPGRRVCRTRFISAAVVVRRKDKAANLAAEQKTALANLPRRTEGELTEGEAAAGAAELREIADGRADLLAEAAGTGLGFYEGQPLFEDRARAEARLLIAAGADEALIPEWAEEGRRRAEAAQRPPFSGGVRPLGHQAALRRSRLRHGPIPLPRSRSEWPSRGGK
jgi:hypothetical protein